jgi:LmbE family N-acetylglucosaminyl deacetylase
MSDQDHNHPPAWKKFLARLTDEARPSIAAYNVAVVVAHPDDETIACGATLKRLRGAHVVVITDGVPRDSRDRNQQTAAVQSRVTARWRELLAALELAGHKPSAVKSLAIADRKAAEHLVAITRRLTRIFAESGTAIALTHAYEGGDPDHDATAFAVHQAAALCRRAGQDVTVIEMPLRQAPATKVPAQQWTDAIILPLTVEARLLKKTMLACFEGGGEIKDGLAMDAERFRLAPDYDFEEPANRGLVSYDGGDGELGPGRWCNLVASARLRLSKEEALRRFR